MNLKIPFSFKVYIFITNMLLLFSLIILTDSIISYIFFINIFFLFLFNFLVYKIYTYKKWALYFFIVMFGIIGIYDLYLLIFNSGIFSGKLKPVFFSSIIIGSFTSWVFIKLIIFYKNYKLGVDNLDKKYITNKKQGLLLLKLYSLLMMFFLIFRFGYYDFPKDIKNIDDNFFIIKYENTDIPYEKNMFFSFEKFNYDISPIEHKSRKLKEDIIKCIYKNNCYSWKVYEEKINELKLTKNAIRNINGNKFNFITNSNEISKVKIKLKNTNILYMFENITYMEKTINELAKKIYWKYPYSYNDFETLDKNIIIFTWIFQYYRELNYQTLYYLENNKEEQAIKLVNDMLKIGNTIIDGDGGVIQKLVAITLLNITYKNISIIINNYSLSDENIKILTESLSKRIEKSYLDNSIKYEYKFIKLQMDAFNIGIYNNFLFGFNFGKYNTTLYKYNEESRLLKLYFYDIIKNLYNSTNNKKYEVNYFKSNLIGQILHSGYRASYFNQYKKLEEIEVKRQKLIEKLKDKLNF